MTAARWVEHGGYSGLVKSGAAKVELPTGERAALHLERAFYLVAQLEAPHWGSVQGYDGAGLSGGPLHSIAYLKGQDAQGPLFALLRAVQDDPDGGTSPDLAALLDAFATEGWRLAPNGVLVQAHGGAPVAGAAIRDVLSPPNGKVPKAGAARQQAERWCELLFALLSDPTTFAAQQRFTIEYLLRTQRDLETSVYEGILGRALGPIRELRVATEVGSGTPGWSPEADLALCVYHAHSVNAPGIARECLERAKDLTSPADPAFPAALIHTLGKKRYGRWADTADDKNRYDRTRLAARRSGLWPATLFGNDGLMPTDLAPRAPHAARPTLVASAAGTLKLGAEGDAVHALQEALTALDYAPGEVDGHFGTLTARALKRFQRDRGLPVTGQANRATRAALTTAPSHVATLERTVPSAAAGHRVDAFLRAPLRSGVYVLQRDALGSYFERCQDDAERVSFAERLARTAEWLFELGVKEEGGDNRGPWVDFLRVTGGGALKPNPYPPWCAYFVSACLRITDWVGSHGAEFRTSAGAARLWIDAPPAARIARESVAALDAPRGAIFVRTRGSAPEADRDRVLAGTAREGHTGIVVDREHDGTLVCIAGNSSGAGHSRVSGAGKVAMELIGPRNPASSEALARLVGLVRYSAPD